MSTLVVDAANKDQLATLLVEGVVRAYIGELELTSLPPLPASLKVLACSANNLSVLPALPAGMTALYCNENKLTALPALPSELQTLVCSWNEITVLPEFPATLKQLDCSHTPITVLPELPETLRILKCQYTKIVVLPKIPDKTVPDVSYNPELTTVTLPFGREMRMDDVAGVMFDSCPKLSPKPFPDESMDAYEARVAAPPELEINIPAGQTDVISMSEIEDGTRMVDFQDERSKHRYYTEQTYNSLNPKKNPFTRAPIDGDSIIKYTAKLDSTLPVQAAGRRRKHRATRRGKNGSAMTRRKHRKQ